MERFNWESYIQTRINRLMIKLNNLSSSDDGTTAATELKLLLESLEIMLRIQRGEEAEREKRNRETQDIIDGWRREEYLP